MPRPVLDESAIHPAVRTKVASLHADVLAQVREAVCNDDSRRVRPCPKYQPVSHLKLSVTVERGQRIIEKHQ